MNDPRKAAICNALAAFIRQRPGLDPRNYISHGADDAGRRAYFSEQRSIARDKRDAETLLLAVRHNDGISADDILEASRSAYMGRLTIEVKGSLPRDSATCIFCARIDYCTNAYFPTEYRRAAAAMCAAALWAWQRENMPAPDMPAPDKPEAPEMGRYAEPRSYEGRSAGDWLRRKFRQDFGSAIQKRWFD